MKALVVVVRGVLTKPSLVQPDVVNAVARLTETRVLTHFHLGVRVLAMADIILVQRSHLLPFGFTLWTLFFASLCSLVARAALTLAVDFFRGVLAGRTIGSVCLSWPDRRQQGAWHRWP